MFTESQNGTEQKHFVASVSQGENKCIAEYVTLATQCLKYVEGNVFF